MSTNLFAMFKKLLPAQPLQVGEVLDSSSGIVTVELPGGGTVQGRGAATVGAQVFVRDGRIEGTAPTLTIVTFDV